MPLIFVTRNIEYYQSYMCIVKAAKGQLYNISSSVIKKSNMKAKFESKSSYIITVHCGICGNQKAKKLKCS